ncbi:MAG: hypothetical protein WC880_00495 [Candidatus Paceibacterota bacterium]
MKNEHPPSLIAEALKESATWAWLTKDDEHFQRVSDLFYFFFRRPLELEKPTNPL